MFHRVDDVRKMPVRRFLKFARMLFNYEGALRARAEQEQEKAKLARGDGFREERGVSVDKHYDDITKNPAVSQLFG